MRAASASHRRMAAADIDSAIPAATASRASSGHDHRSSGAPASAGSWQARALSSATLIGVNRAGRPERLRSDTAAGPPAAYRSRQVRTVSTRIRVSVAIRALDRPCAAGTTVVARSRSRYGVLWPKAIFLSRWPSRNCGGPAAQNRQRQAPDTRPTRRTTAPTISQPAKDNLERRLTVHARTRWSKVTELRVRYRAAFAWFDAELADGEVVPLIRLRHLGSADEWGFGLYLASSGKYEDQVLPTGGFTGAPKKRWIAAEFHQLVWLHSGF